jgi:hypothetical protein
MVVVSVDDVGVPREILGPIRNNDALITQNLGATPNQRCKDSNLVAATPEAQCEIDCHHLGTGTPPQGTVCYKHEHLKPFWYIGRPYVAEFHSKARPLQNCKRLLCQASKPSISFFPPPGAIESTKSACMPDPFMPKSGSHFGVWPTSSNDGAAEER